MGYYRVRGFPLEHRNIGENEVLLTLYSLEMGKIRIAVRGTKKINSSLRSSLMPLNKNIYFITERRTSDLLLEWAPVKTYKPSISSSLEKLACAGYAAHYILSLVPHDEPDEQLFHLLENIYTLLVNLSENHDIIKLLFEWGFMCVMGIAPPVESCAGCGTGFESGFLWWDIPDGNMYCSSCRNKGASNNLRLSLAAMIFGNIINTLSHSLLQESTCETERLIVEETQKLAAFKHQDRTAFGKAVEKFCRYHLKEEISCWSVRL